MLPVLTTAILLSIRKDILIRDMEGINDLFQSFLHLDDPKFKSLLPEPDVLTKHSMKITWSAKQCLLIMDEFMSDKEYYGQEQFKRYLHHYRDYLITGQGKLVDFKVFDFAAESIKGPESRLSSQASEIFEKNAADLRVAEDGLIYAESQHQVPDESVSHHVMDGFIQN